MLRGLENIMNKQKLNRRGLLSVIAAAITARSVPSQSANELSPEQVWTARQLQKADLYGSLGLSDPGNILKIQECLELSASSTVNAIVNSIARPDILKEHHGSTTDRNWKTR